MEHETRTIQVWPSGNGYEYRGDPYGPPHERAFRRTERCGGEYGNWLDADADPCDEDWLAIRVELHVERYIDQEILKCDSSLVCALLAARHEGLPSELASEWTWDCVTGLYPDPSDWNGPACLRWLDEHTSGPNHYAARADDWDGELARFAVAENVKSDEFEDWAEQQVEELRDGVREQAEPADIYEWWAVTEWLAGQLTAIGQPVLDNAYGYWWGRTCTGQAMKMDGTLQQIARRQETTI